MRLTERFSQRVKRELEDFAFENIYDRIERDNEYESWQLRRMICLTIYYLGQENRCKKIPTLECYLRILNDDDLRPFLTIEQLLFIVQLCSEWSNNSPRESNKAMENLYI